MPEHFDVLIIGAGLSGIGSAAHLETELPGKTYAILEARDGIGGTWDLFRYPGIRSDSDMFTLGYSFKRWDAAKAIADGPSIRQYIRETAAEYGIERHIRYGHRVVRADWDSETALWTVEAETGHGRVSLTARFVHWCSGYYDYEKGFSPDLPGVESFTGRIVHPQHWPEDLDYSGQRVVVIGSGATAVTLVPAMARDAAHVTMLQRSPSYVVSLPGEDPVVDWAIRHLPRQVAWQIARWKAIGLTTLSYQLSRRRPEVLKAILRRGLLRELPDGYDVDRDFKPRYNPWDQRLCVVPDGDLFQAIRSDRADVVTDTIETFTERGIRLTSGRELEADLIVTATGLNLQMLGGASLSVDGREVAFGDTVAYKGMMFSGVPNAALSIGYTNASWTLKCDLICEYVCRLLKFMDERDYAYCVPVAPPEGEPLDPLIDFSSGYVLRAIATLPKQGSRPPWRLNQNYFRDIGLFRRAPLDDEGMRFVSGAEAASGRPASEALAA
ncbi:MAG TPA: NAD(P)/FAD-dependent oxidoreductase [Solirubrobacteraceae bacterium]|jgi:cation diffusion facilitator CzcD-associated flavoprotein CzcO|nr:NAD(P)/FAD-dependent oxidoreductase [Solirubrobacteraceae bacterium]